MTEFAKMAPILNRFPCSCATSIHDVEVAREAPMSSTDGAHVARIFLWIICE